MEQHPQRSPDGSLKELLLCFVPLQQQLSMAFFFFFFFFVLLSGSGEQEAHVSAVLLTYTVQLPPCHPLVPCAMC